MPYPRVRHPPPIFPQERDPSHTSRFVLVALFGVDYWWHITYLHVMPANSLLPLAYLCLLTLIPRLPRLPLFLLRSRPATSPPSLAAHPTF